MGPQFFENMNQYLLAFRDYVKTKLYVNALSTTEALKTNLKLSFALKIATSRKCSREFNQRMTGRKINPSKYYTIKWVFV